MLIDLLDRALTRLFATKLVIWIAMHVLHIPAEKCSLCYTRVRWAQLMLWCTKRLDRIEWLHSKRVDWRVRVNHARAESSPTSTQVAAFSPWTSIPPHYLLLPVRENDPPLPLTVDQLPSSADILGAAKYLSPVPAQHRWWPRTSTEEHEATVRELGSRANYGEW